jgi:hypothetical protein
MIGGANSVLLRIICASLAGFMLVATPLRAQASWVRLVVPNQPVDDSLSDRSFKSKNGVYANFHILTNPLLAGWKNCARVEFRMTSKNFVPRLAIVQSYRHLGGQLSYDTLARSGLTDSASSEARMDIACPVQWEPVGERNSPYLVASSAEPGSRGSYGLTITVVEAAQIALRPLAEPAERSGCRTDSTSTPLISLESPVTLGNSVDVATWHNESAIVFTTSRPVVPGSAPAESKAIYIWRLVGPARLMTRGRAPAPSPDGRRIAFVRASMEQGHFEMAVWVRFLDDGHEIKAGAWPWPSSGDDFRMRWSAITRALLIAEPLAFGTGGLLVFDLDSVRVLPFQNDLEGALDPRPSTRLPPYLLTTSPYWGSWLRAAGTPEPEIPHRIMSSPLQEVHLTDGVWLWNANTCFWQHVLTDSTTYAEVSPDRLHLLTISSGNSRQHVGRLAVWKLRTSDMLGVELRMVKVQSWHAPVDDPSPRVPLSIFAGKVNPLTGVVVGANEDSVHALGWVNVVPGKDTLTIHMTALTGNAGVRDGDVAIDALGQVAGFLVHVPVRRQPSR